MRPAFAFIVFVVVVSASCFATREIVGAPCETSDDCNDTDVFDGVSDVNECLVIDGASVCAPIPVERPPASCLDDDECFARADARFPVEVRCFEGQCGCFDLACISTEVPDVGACRCVTPGENGDPCVVANTCARGFSCDDRRCSDEGGPGALCVDEQGCSTNVCRRGVCAVSEGGVCATADECALGICDGGFCRQFGSAGALCLAGVGNCDAGDCVDGRCP